MSGRPGLIVRQFGRPSGILGYLAGFIMQSRGSNRERNRRTLELLELQPGDHVLEVGFGPGLAIEEAARSVVTGRVVGLDHSALMLRQAGRRNARGITEGRVELRLGSADVLPEFDRLFDKVLAVNTYMFWSDPVAVVHGLRGVMRPGGRIALTTQPRNRGATFEHARAAADHMAGSLRQGGYEDVHIVYLELAPVAAACVLGRAPQ